LPRPNRFGQETRTLPPKPGVILSHHRAFTPTSSVLFLCFRWMEFQFIMFISSLIRLGYQWSECVEDLGVHPLRYVILAVEAAVLVYFLVAVGWFTVFVVLLAVVLGGSVYLVIDLRRRDEEEVRHLQSVNREGP